MRRRPLLALGIVLAQAGLATPAAADDAGIEAGVGAEAGAGAAQSADAGAGAGTDGGAAGAVSGCVETLPKGAERPFITETFPPRGTSGWAATLAITVKHGKGERVLPAGLDLSNAAEMKKVLAAAGFAIPEQGGAAGARVWSDPEDKASGWATTHVDLPVLVLPEKPGRARLELPPLPVAVSRANGEIATVCTKPHLILVEDPTAEVPEAEPKPNPPARPQREEWTSLKKALTYGSIGLLGGALIAYLAYRIATKPKPPPPPPPPRPPWEIALEKLDIVRHAGLLDAGRYMEYIDRVSDAVRGYLGARFGFDGLESTTDELLALLARHGGGFVRLESGAGPQPGIPLADVSALLRECDLVKFANLTPSEEQCERALTAGEKIVRSTMPTATASLPEPAAEAAAEPAAAKKEDGGDT
jgi:hypothetical protein